MAWDGKDFVGMLTILSLDQIETYERLQTDPFHQPARRSWVRTLCSQVEAFAFGMKQFLASTAQFPNVRLTPLDVMLLREESYEITDSGETKIKSDRWVRPETNLKFVAKIAGRALNFEYSVNPNAPGWKALMSTFRVRNRLVHPKSAADLIVQDEEIVTTNEGHSWFQSFQQQLWDRINEGLKGTNG
jgi:hypothetical protein